MVLPIVHLLTKVKLCLPISKDYSLKEQQKAQEKLKQLQLILLEFPKLNE